jgi:hypothetical protein
MKQIEVTFPNGETWRIPAQVVAEDRARYFSELNFARGDVTDKEAAFLDEVNFVLSDAGEDELLDYFRNNMDWNDVQAHAVKVEAVKAFDYAEAFDSATFTVKG